MASFIIDGVVLHQTCFACPEQYDAFMDGKLVGYLRLRHGYFFASCPLPDGEVVYDAQVLGDGSFRDKERMYYLQSAVAAIKAWVAAHPGGEQNVESKSGTSEVQSSAGEPPKRS